MATTRELLASFSLDNETVEYLANALTDAEADEWQELLEPFLSEDDLGAVLEKLKGDAGGASQPSRFTPPPRQVEQAPIAQPVQLGEALKMDTGQLDQQEDDTTIAAADRKTKPKAVGSKTRKAKAEATKPRSENRRDNEPLVEVTCKLSRFHNDTFDHKFTGINIEGVCVSIEGRDLIKDALLDFQAGTRYGLLGQNGAGKSTLLRAMGNGSIPAWPRNCRALFVEQEDIGDERSSLQVVMAASEEITKLRRQEALLAKADTPEEARRCLLKLAVMETGDALRTAELYAAKLSRMRGKQAAAEELKARQVHADAKAALEMCSGGEEQDRQRVTERLSDVRLQLQLLDADALEGKARRILRGLGFTDESMAQRTDLLSGGWRMRTAIACALVAEPDVMMLDEPTNHLDWPALLWFESYLKTLEDIVLIMVSHDRAFLDEVATGIVRLCNGDLQYFKGNYTEFEEALEKEKIDKANYAERRQDKIDKEWEKVRRMEVEGRRANNSSLLSQVASRKKKLGVGTSHGVCRVGAERDADGKAFRIFTKGSDSVDHGAAQVVDDAAVKLNIQVAGNLGFDGALLQCRQLQFGYDRAKPFSQGFDLNITLSSRIAFLGMNGSGKTTLVRTIAGELPPLAGEVYTYPRLIVAYFSQHVADSLPLDQTPIQSLKERFPDAAEYQIRAILGSFGIRQQATVPLGCLSGGEKARVSLASITFKPPHILLLDEPTNHLDLNTVEALATALKGFGGGIVLVSHDRRMIEALDMECYTLHSGKLNKSSLKEFVRLVRQKHVTS